APLIFLMRERSLRSTGPNLVKSTLGQGSRSRPAPEPPPPAGALAAWALVCAAPLITCLVKFWMSSCVMRPLGPEPLTSSSGTPSSRANLRTDGEAWGSAPLGALVGSCGAAAAGVAAGALAVAAAGAGAGAAWGAAAAGAGAADAAPATPSSTSTTEPSLTLSPTLTFTSLTTPAADDGISIEALSDSTVISDCSTCTV